MLGLAEKSWCVTKMNNFKYTINKTISVISSKLMNNGIDCYWWNGRTNFGDLLTPELLNTFGKTAIHRFPAQHNNHGIVMVGSLIQMLSPSYAGNILGTGIIENKPAKFPDATIWSVRGELTKKAMSLQPNLPTGDFGLLADKLLHNKPQKNFALGLVPHYVDKKSEIISNLLSKYPQDILLIDVERPAQAVVRDIARCRMIASSSLHGLIVADALGLPNIWLKISEDVIGDGFKFHDYNSAIDTEQHPFSPSDTCTLLNLEQNMTIKNTKTIAEKKKSMEALLIKIISELK